MHEEHVRDRRRYTNRLREQLLRYFLAFLELEGDLDADWNLELLERALTPRSAATLSRVHVTKILERNRVRGRDAEKSWSCCNSRPLPATLERSKPQPRT